MNRSTRNLLRLTRTLHTYLTMFSSVVIFFFALSGFMLNHRSWFGLQGEPRGSRRPALGQQGSAEPARTDRAPMQPYRHSQPNDDRADKGPSASERPAQKSGPLAKLTSLHKGKPRRPAVVLLVDVTAVVLMLGSITGIILLLSLPRRRRWGLLVMGLGTVAGLMVYLLAIP